jgi:nucleoside-diphosphate-sugar epimerase
MTNSAPILVTGASGFIGQQCVTKLVEQGHVVRAFVLPHEDVSNAFPEHVEVVRGDISIAADVQKACSNIGGAIHLAAVVGDAGTDELHQKVTVGGTRNLLEAAPEAARVVVISSIVYYGTHLQSHTCYESTPAGEAVGVYSRAKQAQERVTWDKINQGANVSIVRPANVYGPRSGPWVDDACELLKVGMPALIDGGNGNAGLVYVSNVVDVILAALFTQEAKGRAYNACDELDVTWKEYFSELAQIVGGPKPRSIPRWAAQKGASLCETIWGKAKLKSRPLMTHEALNLIGSNHRVPSKRAQEELGIGPGVDYPEAMDAIRLYLISL